MANTGARRSTALHTRQLTVSPLALNRLSRALYRAYGRDTCYPPLKRQWTPNRRYVGQCAVTALVVQDHLGGVLVHDAQHGHFWNKVGGKDIDLTKDQFPEDVELAATGTRDRNDMLTGPRARDAETHRRYRLLASRVARIMIRAGR